MINVNLMNAKCIIKAIFNKILTKSFERIKKKREKFEGEPPLAVPKKVIEDFIPEKSTSISEDMLIKIINGLK